MSRNTHGVLINPISIIAANPKKLDNSKCLKFRFLNLKYFTLNIRNLNFTLVYLNILFLILSK